jgi:hypothetical protein
MRRACLTGVVAVMALALGGLTAASASAACLRVDKPETGNKAAGCANNVGATKNEFVLAQAVDRKPTWGPGLWCAKVEAGQTAGVNAWEMEPECLTEPERARTGSKWIRVEDVPPPVFLGPPVPLRSLAGPTTLSANSGTDTVSCSSSTGSGEVEAAKEVGQFVLHYTGCTSSEGGKSGCSVKSSGAPAAGLILTRTLRGLLGLVLPGSTVGLLLLPSSGKILTELEGNECTIESAVSGSIAGELSPIGVLQTTGKLVLAASSGKQSITDIDIENGLVKPQLTAFTTAALEIATFAITYSTAIEVT